MEDDFYYGELPELPPPVANTTPDLVDEDDNPVENPDLELGWLKNETKTVHHDAVEGVKKVSHYEVNLKPDGTPAIYYDANGKEYGRDVHEVIDVPGVQARDAYDEEVAFIRYIKYTAEELAKKKAEKEKQEERQKAVDTLPETLAALQSAQTENPPAPRRRSQRPGRPPPPLPDGRSGSSRADKTRFPSAAAMNQTKRQVKMQLMPI